MVRGLLVALLLAVGPVTTRSKNGGAYRSSRTVLTSEAYVPFACHERRLAANPNDIAGLITMAGYDLHYADHASYSNVANRVLSVVSNVTTSAFQSEMDFFVFSISESLNFMTIYHPTEEERMEDIAKSARPGLFFIYEEPLRLLDQDGYFANDPPMPEPQLPSSPVNVP